MRIHAFYNYLAEEKVITENIACKVKMQKKILKLMSLRMSKSNRCLLIAGQEGKSIRISLIEGTF